MLLRRILRKLPPKYRYKFLWRYAPYHLPTAPLIQFLEPYDRFGPDTVDRESFTNPMLRVNWNLGNVCTYRCSYCSKHCHDGSHPWPETEKALNAVREIDRVYKQAPHNKQTVVFELLGGEPTIWPGLDELVELIKDTGNQCMLVTNGVRTLDWWKKNAHNFDYVTLSFHPESADYRHLTQVSQLLADAGVPVSILCLMYPPRWDYCIEARDYFVAHSRARTVNLQMLTLLKGSRSADDLGLHESRDVPWPYSEEQRTWFLNNREYIDPEAHQTRPWVETGMKFFKKSGTRKAFRVSSAFLTSHGLNGWKDWDCYIGLDTLFLEQNGDVRREAMCRAAKPFANWKSDDLSRAQWPTRPTKCPFTHCFCSHDYRSRKVRPGAKDYVPSIQSSTL